MAELVNRGLPVLKDPVSWAFNVLILRMDSNVVPVHMAMKEMVRDVLDEELVRAIHVFQVCSEL